MTIKGGSSKSGEAANRRGFISLHRAVFEHALFKDERPFTRLQAWVWMLCDAAWRKSQRRVGVISVNVERGQIAATTRGLAKEWGWHESKVRRFLATLQRQEMVFLSLTTGIQADAAPDAAPDAMRPHPITLISICNYSKFNDLSTAANPKPTQHPTQHPTQVDQQAFDFDGEIAPNHLNQLTKETTRRGLVKVGGRVEAGRLSKPRHGATSKDGKLVWFDHGTSDWELYANDYRDVTGTERFPDVREGGKGNWFKRNGEAALPARSGAPIIPARGIR